MSRREPVSDRAHDQTPTARRSPDRRSVINRRAGEERGSPARVRVRFAVGCAETSALGLPLSQPSTTSIPPLSDSDAVVHPPERPVGFEGVIGFGDPKYVRPVRFSHRCTSTPSKLKSEANRTYRERDPGPGPISIKGSAASKGAPPRVPRRGPFDGRSRAHTRPPRSATARPIEPES